VSKKSSVRFLVALLFVTFTTAALVVADLGVLAQNANSSTTQDESMQNANATNTGTRRRGRRRGRGRAPAANANANMAGEANANTGEAMGQNTNTGMENANTGGMTTGRRGRRGRRRAAAANANMGGAESAGMGANANMANLGGEQTDLSGTYTGTVSCLDANGQGTLTINGNQFTLESGGTTHSGRVTAVTTRGYTGATLRFDATGGGTPTAVSVRAHKAGDRLVLTPVPGETNRCSFTPGGGGMRRGRRRASANAATPAEPATPGVEPATPATPSPRSRGRRRGRRRGATSTNTNANDNTNTPPPQR
jgi:hypothetical protein